MDDQRKLLQDLTDHDKQRLYREQVVHLFSFFPFSLAVGILNAAILASVQWPLVDRGGVIIWLALLGVISLLRARLYLIFNRSPPETIDYRWLIQRHSRHIVFYGMVWGAAGHLLFPQTELINQMLTIFILGGMALGSISTLSAILLPNLLFIGALLLPLLFNLYTREGGYYLEMALVGSLFMVVVLFSAVRSSRNISDSIRLRFVHRRTEAALEASNEQNRLLLESTSEGIFGIDINGVTTFANPAAARMLGYSVAEMVGRDTHQLIHHSHQDGSNYPAERCRMLAPLRDAQSHQVNNEVLWRKDGSYLYVEYSSTPILQQGEVRGAVVSFRDITKRHEAEQLLQDERSLFVGGPIVVFKWGAAEGWPVEYVSPNVAQQFGYAQQDFLSGQRSFADIVHPDDLSKITQIMDNHESPIPGQFEQEYRIRKADGEWLWVYDFTVIHRNESGVVTHYHGYLVDVSEKKSSEEALRLAATAFDAHEAIAITDAQGHFLQVNNAFTKITGYRSDEVIGRSPNLLQSGRHEPEFYSRMWRQLHVKGHWEGEIWNRRKGGEVYPEWLSITTVKDELGVVSHYLAHFQDITERKKAEAHIRYQAYYDPLTELPNRRRFIEVLEQELSRARRHTHYGAILFIDMDRFKPINDSLGHAVGDQVLQQLAQRLKSCLRTEDTAARLGGDEFIVLLAELSDEFSRASEVATEIAEKVRLRLGEAYLVDGHTLHTTPSIGITLLPESSETAEELIKQADIAMYCAKEQGRNQIQRYSHQMQERAKDRLTLESELRQALERDELLLYYQPQLDIDANTIGAEALVRWNHPQRGLLSPGEFLHAAEDSGLISQLGDWVLRRVCEQISGCAGHQHYNYCSGIGVNINPGQFQQADFVEKIIALLEETGVHPSRLELELTEQLLLDNIEEAIRKIEQLRALGIHFAIDDFGTGYSSLSYLKRLPVDKLKIDASFIRDITHSHDDAVIVDTIISMSRHLGIAVIAEGVETLEQVALLKEKGCTNYQGYYFSPPLPFAEFVAFMDETPQQRITLG